MTKIWPPIPVLTIFFVVAWHPEDGLSQEEAALPGGVRAVWDPAKAHREKTATRERVCLNGLWRWQPLRKPADSLEAVPADRWGHFKVPGFWPGNSSYEQEDCQTLHAHPSWKDVPLAGVTTAWYQREFAVPEGWGGRRIVLAAEVVNSFAVVYVDGRKVGEIRFPSGVVDLSPFCRAGRKHVLSLLVAALPLKAVMLSHSDTNGSKEVAGSVSRRGLCGDVFLMGVPSGPRIAGVKIDTSVRKGEITLGVSLEGLEAEARYVLRAEVRENGQKIREFTGSPFKGGDLAGGRVALTEKWKAPKLWDLHTPGNMYEAEVSLLAPGGKLLDAESPARFGFREFWIDGRDFLLNGTRLFLSAVPLDNAGVGARTATYEGARETMKRLQSFGINFVYTHNYGCEPGMHVGFGEILRAADDAGMLVAFSQPHFEQYDWETPEAERMNGYAGHAEFYVRAAQNHPSVVAYSMSHNATGYDEQSNPDLMDGIQDPRSEWGRTAARRALRAEAIVKSLDPSRVVYHHSSGNLGSMHTSNFYANFVPIQELSDWFESWAIQGTKPVFPVEYGLPCSWDWTQFRGWYKGQRNWGSAGVPWEFCLAEWNSQFLGDRAFQTSDAEKMNLRWEAEQFRAGNLWHRWDYPQPPGSGSFDQVQTIFAMYLTDVLRAHRTWGVSALNPAWEYASFWTLRPGLDRRRKELRVDWDNLQRPGFSPDYVDRRAAQIGLDFERSDWIPTAAADALHRNNRPLLAYLGGKPEHFTGKDHNFHPGETVQKQLIIINNTRQTVSCDAEWSFDLPQVQAGIKKVSVRTGEQERIPLHFALPASLAGGTFGLRATVRFPSGETQADSLSVSVLPRLSAPSAAAKKALFDPKGQTAKLLSALGVSFQRIDSAADLSSYDVLIIGKEALTSGGPGPDVCRVRDGLKVLVFEQESRVLEERFGFRVAEYGLRNVCTRVKNHPVLAGLEAEHLRDWRGEATILAPRLKYDLRPQYGPVVRWCGIDVTRAWRCGSRGNVASVLIEKPARGDFLPILDGGYSLQYSPLLEYREGSGVVLFCQMDVTGRTESDPAADRFTRNLVDYVSSWKSSPSRKAFYAGEPAGKSHLESAGFSPGSFVKGSLSQDSVLVLGPGGGPIFSSERDALDAWLKHGGHVLAIGLGQADLDALLPFKVRVKSGEHISAFFEPFARSSLLTGIGPADVHNRDPREFPLVCDGAAVIGNGILAKADPANVVFCQIPPWRYDPKKQMNLKRTFRRSSFLLTRLLSNMGVHGATPILARFHAPVDPARAEKRWLEGLYLDVPEEWDDPYRYFCW